MNKFNIKNLLAHLHPRNLKNLSVATTVIASVFLAILTLGIFAGNYARSLIYKNKLADTWAIMYLEAESVSNRMRRIMTNQIERGSTRNSSTLTWDGHSDTLTASDDSLNSAVSIKNLGYDNGRQMFGPNQPTVRILSLDGKIFVASIPRPISNDPGTRTIVLRTLPGRIITEVLSRKSTVSTVSYLATREGKLIYSNSPSITDVNFVTRPLVQSFISSPLSGQLQEFTSKEGVPEFGFFVEVHDSNLVLFSEAPKSLVLSSLSEVVKRYIIVLFVIVILVLIGVSFPVMRLTNPLVDLARVARGVGAGDLNLRAAVDGYGEVAELGEAFNGMIDGLNERDKEIRELLVEKTEKVRLESELKIAQGIQTNLLPQAALTSASGLEIAAEYIPAGECAGDWYHYHYNESAKETIIAVVDVSGHGAGSSMFTALIAGVFERYRKDENGPWNLESIMRDVGDIVFRFGKGAWHATVLVARYNQSSGMLDLISSGHTPPFIIQKAVRDGEKVISEKEGKSSRGIQKIRLPAPILGASSTTEFCSKSMPLIPGDLLFMYTDGFTEAKNTDGKMISPRRLETLLKSCESLPPSQALISVIGEWKKHCRGQPAADDVCLLMMRAS